MKIYVFFLTLLCSTFAFGQTPPAFVYCPSVSSLTKQELLWSAPEGWISYGESFDTQVLHFIKAEWIGINVGKVICLYKGDKKYAFPIALEQKHNKLVPSPSGYAWSKDLGGRKECISEDIKKCPFIFEQAKEETDPYQQLDFFKNKPSIE